MSDVIKRLKPNGKQENRKRLIQEDYVDTDYGPWKVLVICQCLNQATWMVVEKVVEKLFEKYPNPKSVAKADPLELFEIVRSLGFGARRTDNLIDMSKQYRVQEEEFGDDYELYDILSMEGCGVYALDAWQLFVLKIPCNPKDRHLKRYADNLEVKA